MYIGPLSVGRDQISTVDVCTQKHSMNSMSIFNNLFFAIKNATINHKSTRVSSCNNGDIFVFSTSASKTIEFSGLQH